MSTVEEPEYVAKTLAWCNDIRKEKGLEPLAQLPKGLRGNGLSCPCGKATGFYVGTRTYLTQQQHDDGVLLMDGQTVPMAVTMFVRAFDNEELPQYDESPPIR